MKADLRKKIAERKLKNIPNRLNADAVISLILRVTKSEKYASSFVIKQVDGQNANDKYRMYSKDGKIVIEANTGVAACVAFNYYLKTYCNSFYGPLTDNISLPENPPEIDGIIEAESAFLYRYFLNYCTFSYTYLFAGWKEWERLTDFMLLSGVNLYLNIIGHELVWHDTLISLGYSREDIDKFICGPAYLPWQWMANMTGFGGNLTDNWYNKQKVLSNRINSKMREFSSEVMLPGYYGMVPADFAEKFPEAAPVNQGGWCGLERPALLKTTDPMFARVADAFYTATKQNFGECKFFSADPFHEGGNTKGVDLGQFGIGVLQKMQEYNKDSVWFLQGWQDNPKRDMLKALSKEDVLVGNLSADNNYGTGDDFCGYPWLYLTTPNFGGTRKMSGNMRGLIAEPLDILDKPEQNSMVGIGMTMEAVEIDEVIFDLFATLTFSAERFTQKEYIEKYVTARYGYCNSGLLEAFKLLADNMYTNEGSNLFGSKESSLCPRPNLKTRSTSTWGENRDVPYARDILPRIINLLLAEYDKLKDNTCYKFDLADITRQAVSDKGWDLIKELDKNYDEFDREAFSINANKYLALFDIQEELMSGNELTRLEHWVNRARDYGDTAYEKNIYVYNAKNLITLWAPKENSQELRDYSHREWAGMLKPFYKRRWQAYLNALQFHFDDRENLPTIDWKEFDYVFLMSENACTPPVCTDLKSAVEKALKSIS